MHVVMLSTDTKVFDGGAVADRIQSYGTIVDSLLFVIFATGESKQIELASNVRVVSTGGSHKIFAYLRGIAMLLKETAGKRYDLLSSQDPFMLGLAGLLVSKFRGLKFQVQLHTDCFSEHFATESLRRRFESWIARIVIPSASGVRVVSERLAHVARALTTEPVVVLPLPLVHSLEKEEKRPKEFNEAMFTLLTVSRFTKEKQINLLVEALALVPNTQLLILGDGPEKEGLERLILDKGLSARVQLLPWQNPVPFYAHADAFLLVSRYEGYGLAIMEAALNGLPILATNVGVVGYELMAGKEVLVVKPEQGSIASAIVRIKGDELLRQDMGASARKKAMTQIVTESEYLARYRAALVACMP